MGMRKDLEPVSTGHRICQRPKNLSPLSPEERRGEGAGMRGFILRVTLEQSREST
jgi:hypothetical protein